MGWVKLTDQRATNRKLRQAGLAARGLDEAVMCQISADKTDGHVTRDTVEMLCVAHHEKDWEELVDTLVEVGRWEVNGTGWYVHDYLEFNPTKAQWEAEQAKKRDAGRQGGQAKARADALARARASARADGIASGTADALANVIADPTRLVKTTPPAPPPSSRPPQPDRGGGGDSHLVNQAMTVLAERALAVTANVRDPAAFLAATRRRRADHHANTLDNLDLSRFATPDQLADHLEPPTPKPVTPVDIAQAAAAAKMARNDKPACPTCGTRGGHGWLPDTSPAVRCPDCADQ